MMRDLGIKHLVLLAITGLGLSGSAAGQTIWSGFHFTFTKPPFASPPPVDELTANVGFTRGDSQGLYNAAQEGLYTFGTSPAGTRWATSVNNPGKTISATNWADLSFTTWESAYGGPSNLAFNITARDAVVHLIMDDIYLDLSFIAWGVGFSGGGSFAYNRAIGAAGPKDLVWDPTGTGGNNWSTNPASTNWLDGATPGPFADGDIVHFTDSGVGAVVVDAGGVAPGASNITNSSGTYTFSGGAIGGAGALSKSGGGAAVLENVNSYTGGTNVSDGTLTFAARIPTGAVSISGGTLRVGAKGAPNDPSGASVITLLTITDARLDLTNNSLTVQSSSLSEINALLVSGYAGGSWNGVGINSSTAAAEAGRALGIRQVDGDVEVAFTWSGDATLDGAVTIADLGVLAANWQQTNRLWFQGDFNYDGQVTIADLGILAANWQKGTGGGAGMSFEGAMAMFDVFDGVVVPEPRLLALLPLGLLVVMRSTRLRLRGSPVMCSA